MELHEILFIIFGLLGLAFGGAFWRKFGQAVKLLSELSDLLSESDDLFDKAAAALKDRKVTKAEAVLLLKEWQEVSAEFRDVYFAFIQLLPASAIKFLFRR